MIIALGIPYSKADIPNEFPSEEEEDHDPIHLGHRIRYACEGKVAYFIAHDDQDMRGMGARKMEAGE
jgi:hypothetical protein